jgi:hypothetical protein
LREGKLILDSERSCQDKGEIWLQAAADSLKTAGFGRRVVIDKNSKVLTGVEGELGY